MDYPPRVSAKFWTGVWNALAIEGVMALVVLIVLRWTGLI